MLNKTLFIGKYFKELDEIDSTNSFANTLIKNGEAKNGMVIFTQNQTSGKGQRENIWLSDPYKNLTFSIILKTDFIIVADQFLLNMSVSNAVLEFTKSIIDQSKHKCEIKWPNDILVDGRKISGILIENSIKNYSLNWTIIGIGYNLNQKKIQIFNRSKFQAISATDLTMDYYDIEEHLENLCCIIEKWYLILRGNQFKEIINAYKSNLYGLNKELEFKWKGEIETFKIIGVGRNGNIEIINKVGLKMDIPFNQLKYN